MPWGSIDNAISYRVGRDDTDSFGFGLFATTDPGSATSRVFDKLLLNTNKPIQALSQSGSVITSATVTCCDGNQSSSSPDINKDGKVASVYFLATII